MRNLPSPASLTGTYQVIRTRLPQRRTVVPTLPNAPIGGCVDETIARTETFQGVERAVAAVTKQLPPVDFARRWTVFAEGDPADRLYIIISGKVKISHR